jgi:hypothetical protein
MGWCRLGIERDRLLQRGTHVHEILYEDLILDPTGEMMKVCRFLRIPFDRKMGSLEGSDCSAISASEHHTLVRGVTIVSSRSQAEVLPASFKRKIERYQALWREQHGDWPIFRRSQDSNVPRPLLLGRVYDKILYRLLRGWDLILIFIYFFAPLGLLKAYRELRRGPFQTFQDYARARVQQYNLRSHRSEEASGVNTQRRQST